MNYWKEDSILNNYTEETKPTEIFKEVCDSLGNFYSQKGWKYSRSRPKIKFEKDDLILEINFWSSHSNMAGSYVQLEILPYVSSKKLKKWIKETEIGRNDSIFGPTKYSFRNNNVYGITEDSFTILTEKIDNYIASKLNICDNDAFVERMFEDLNESIVDNFACYLAMKNDKRMLNVIEFDNGLKIDSEISSKLKKYYS
ncbi:hypothetical protein [Flavobacterium succinicans]|uniref:DUF4304 domain-containing protein n=1 Tax=Flavobacterium succinicans TaxID=29536 RepID=A0A199XN51_9FLAO|nr:hypothetical protein [Flavobacterium succinicans]OAZ03075.1 hypothetical protein FLB_25430 [Flavobacterium succinicans]